MGVRLTEEEIDDFLTKGHTLIVASIRKTGEPFMVPLWYVWQDGAFWYSTIATSPKIGHIKRDKRVCCMVEEGKRWVDLHCVVANCDAEIITDEALIERFRAANELKYGPYRLDPALMPGATNTHYAQNRAIVKATPRPGEIRTWYNRKIKFKGPVD